ncbi:MAG: adenylate/guanylate cyclase domain-containing protein [Candidatus Rokuibacteriota bacterium]
MTVERRPAAILSADAKGYSRLMSEDELGTVRTLTAHRAVMRDAVARLRGRVVDSPGDNLLAEFASAVDAVECAVEIQQSLRQRNAELAEGRRLEFRIGVNVGDVMAEADHIYGDAVNVAARLESLADAGGLCVSGAVYDQVATTLALTWESLGEQSMKNIARRVRVYRARPAPAPWAPPGETVLRPAYRPSIAVLPFRELNVGEVQHYFGEGIVEDIIGALASLSDLFVISRNSTAQFRQSPADVASVGQDLGVRYVLSGSIRRAGERIRIGGELADTETRTVLWTDRIEGRLDDLFDLQDRLSEKVVTTIAPHIREAEVRRALRKRPENLDAYDFMLRGLDLLYRLRWSEFDRAHEMFEKSIDLDPGYATSYALTAIWYSIRVGQGWSVDARADYAKARRFAEAALERDPFDPRALALSGHIKAFLFHDYEGALALFDRAIAASPNSAVAWVRSSPTYSYLGDAVEAKRRGEIGLRLSPFDLHLFYTHTALGLACYTGGDFEQAIVWGRKAMSQNPNFTANLRFLAASLAAAGQVAPAREIGRRLRTLEPDFRVRAFGDNYAYKDPARRAALANHLRSAGLPD